MREEVVGHSRILDFLERIVKSERMPHALLFSGKRGIGKFKVATLLAMMYLCKTRDACGSCKSCKSIGKGVHEDFKVVFVPDKKKNISIEDIRELKEWTYVGASSGGKVAIIDDAHLMSIEAANAFLKTLEEPPIGTVFVLVTPSPYKLPQTIVSRCLNVRFQPLTKEDIERICEIKGVSGLKRKLCLMSGSMTFLDYEDKTISKAFEIVDRFERGDYNLLAMLDDLKDEALMELVLFMIRYRLNKRLKEERDKKLMDVHKELTYLEKMFYWSNVSYSSLFEYLFLKVVL